MSEPSAPYLHLEVARARRAVLKAQMRVAACEVLEHASRTRLHRLKVRHFKKAVDVANIDVGQWSDMIRHSGRPLHSRRSPHSRNSFLRRHRWRNRDPGKALEWFIADLSIF